MILLAVCLAVFMLLLDMTIVSSALADLQASLGADLSDLQWVIDAYALPMAGLLLTAATLGDRLGRRRLYLLGMALFTTASLVCALSGSAAMLIGVRAVQGTGGAILLAVSLPIIAAAYPQERRGGPSRSTALSWARAAPRVRYWADSLSPTSGGSRSSW